MCKAMALLPNSALRKSYCIVSASLHSYRLLPGADCDSITDSVKVTLSSATYATKGISTMRHISPSMLAEEMTLVRVSPQDYSWDLQCRSSDANDGDPNWLVASGSTGTETVTGNLLDSDSDDDARYD